MERSHIHSRLTDNLSPRLENKKICLKTKSGIFPGRTRISGSWATRLEALTAHHRSGGGAARQNQKMVDGAGRGKPDEKLENVGRAAQELRGRRRRPVPGRENGSGSSGWPAAPAPSGGDTF